MRVQKDRTIARIGKNLVQKFRLAMFSIVLCCFENISFCAYPLSALTWGLFHLLQSRIFDNSAHEIMKRAHFIFISRVKRSTCRDKIFPNFHCSWPHKMLKDRNLVRFVLTMSHFGLPTSPPGAVLFRRSLRLLLLLFLLLPWLCCCFIRTRDVFWLSKTYASWFSRLLCLLVGRSQ